MTITKDIFAEMKKGILSVQQRLAGFPVMSNDIIETIKPSPVQKHYRNKCEFSIGDHFIN